MPTFSGLGKKRGLSKGLCGYSPQRIEALGITCFKLSEDLSYERKLDLLCVATRNTIKGKE